MKSEPLRNEKPSEGAKLFFRGFLSLLAMVVIYGNLSVIFNSPVQKIRFRALALPDSGQDPFLIFGVFSYYETNNEELSIWGFATDPLTGEENWQQLPAQDYFPFSQGNRNSRMWANRQYNDPRQAGFSEAWHFMGRRIKERYNSLHPNTPVEKVAFQSSTWPRSAEGFNARRSAQETTNEFWIISE